MSGDGCIPHGCDYPCPSCDGVDEPAKTTPRGPSAAALEAAFLANSYPVLRKWLKRSVVAAYAVDFPPVTDAEVEAAIDKFARAARQAGRIHVNLSEVAKDQAELDAARAALRDLFRRAAERSAP